MRKRSLLELTFYQYKMKKSIFVFTLIISALWAQATNYYVAIDGLDTNNGGISTPLKTIEKALSVVQAGDSVLFRAGIWYCTATVQVTVSGTVGKRIFIGAFGNEKPVFDFSKCTFSDQNTRNALRGFYVSGNYLHFKNLEIRYAPDNGMKLEGSNCFIERCEFHHNGDSGLQIGLKSNGVNDGTIVANNLVLNCDAHHNCDPWNGGENADGFACKLFPGAGNVFDGCRSWQNSDDGWDLYETEYLIEIKNCWAWDSGNPSLWNAAEYQNACRDAYATIATWNGDGNGFKLGGAGVAGGHKIHHSVAFSNKQQFSRGFHQNNNGSGIEVYNCTGWDNTVNFGFNDAVTVTKVHELKNNLAFAPYPHPLQSGYSNARLLAGTISENNSWDTATGVIVDASDVISTDVNLALAPREADGSLPNNNFGRISPTSDCINKGKDIGYSFCQSAPDLGAFEYCLASDISEINENINKLSVTPGIIKDFATIEISILKARKAILTVSTVLGSAVYQENLDLTEGKNSRTISMTGLPKGVYICNLSYNAKIMSSKIIKE